LDIVLPVFLWCLLCFFFIVVEAAGFALPEFLFCAAKTDPPAKAKIITAETISFFIVALRGIFISRFNHAARRQSNQASRHYS
jgi:hypothetical protein